MRTIANKRDSASRPRRGEECHVDVRDVLCIRDSLMIRIRQPLHHVSYLAPPARAGVREGDLRAGRVEERRDTVRRAGNRLHPKSQRRAYLLQTAVARTSKALLPTNVWHEPSQGKTNVEPVQPMFGNVVTWAKAGAAAAARSMARKCIVAEVGGGSQADSFIFIAA